MTQRYLVDKLTNATPAETIAALCSACRTLLGELPTPEGLACHVAQSALETGHWKSCHWWNFGNVKASANYDGAVTYFGCNEVLQGKLSWFHPSEQWGWPGHAVWIAKHPFSRPNDNQCRWRAYETIELGALQQLEFLAKRARYAKAWAAGLSGDPAAFAHALKVAGYYTASEALYTKTLTSLFGKYLLLCRQAVIVAQPGELQEDDVQPTHDVTRSARLDEEWLRQVDLEVPWDELRAERDRAVTGGGE